MKKPLTMLEEAQPRNITRADVLMTEGFGLEVDGRMKRSFPTLAARRKAHWPSKPSIPCFRSRCMTLKRRPGRSLRQIKQLSPSRSDATSPFAEATLSRRQANPAPRLAVTSAFLRWKHAERARSSCRPDQGSWKFAQHLRAWWVRDPPGRRLQVFGHKLRQL